MGEAVHVVCPHCHGTNRVPAEKLGAGGRCGHCHEALFTGRPVDLDAAAFARHRDRSDLPLLVDFWAAWCGPCKMMAPVFEQAAAELEPRVRLGKVDTERQQQLAAAAGIRGIPTLILYRSGRELDRVSGAMDAAGLMAWVRQRL